MKRMKEMLPEIWKEWAVSFAFLVSGTIFPRICLYPSNNTDTIFDEKKNKKQ